MTNKTKKILVYVCTALLLAALAVGIVCEVVPVKEVVETTYTVDSVAADSTAVEVFTVDTVAE